MNTITEMWKRFEQHTDIADSRGYGEQWKTMLEHRTEQSIIDAEKSIIHNFGEDFILGPLADARCAVRCQEYNDIDSDNYAKMALSLLDMVEKLFGHLRKERQ